MGLSFFNRVSAGLNVTLQDVFLVFVVKTKSAVFLVLAVIASVVNSVCVWAHVAFPLHCWALLLGDQSSQLTAWVPAGIFCSLVRSYNCVCVMAASPIPRSRWMISGTLGEEMTSGNIFRPCWQLSMRNPTAQDTLTRTAASTAISTGGAGWLKLVKCWNPVSCGRLAGTAVLSLGCFEPKDFWLPWELCEDLAEQQIARYRTIVPTLSYWLGGTERNKVICKEEKILSIFLFCSSHSLRRVSSLLGPADASALSNPKFQHLPLLAFIL